MEINIGDKFRSKHVKKIELEIIGQEDDKYIVKYINHPRSDRVGVVVHAMIRELDSFERMEDE